jgi:hypothetical protein
MVGGGFMNVLQCVTIAAVTFSLAFASRAEIPMVPPRLPVRTLVASAERYVLEHPDDARGHATLARIHALAFVFDTRLLHAQVETLSVRDGEFEVTKLPLPSLSDEVYQQRAGLRPDGFEARRFDLFDLTCPSPEEQLTNLGASIASYQRALAIDETQAASHLGLAFVLEHAARLVAATDVTSLLGSCWRELAIADDLRAYELALPEDAARETVPEAPPGEHPLWSLPSFQAGKAYVRLVQARGAGDAAETAKIADIEASLKLLANKLPFRRAGRLVDR